MIKIFFLPLVIILFPGATDTVPDSPSGLMVEFIRHPEHVAIMDLRPEFSWIVPSNARVQTAYQVLVGSSEEILRKNTADIRDSKKVISSRSSEIELAGKSLSANTKYFWKVRIWNDKDQPCGYSEVQSFTTGTPEGYATTCNSFQNAFIGPKKIVKIADEHYFIDFGKDAFGVLLLEFTPVVPDTIIIHLGEKTKGLNRIDKNPCGSIRYQRVLLPVIPGKNKYTITLPADSRNTGPAAVHLPDTFGIITPFRYCELENCSFIPKPENVIQKTFTCFFDDNSSSFSSSDTILNKVWDICKYSIKATSFAGIYIDGDRERIPYEADAYIDQMGHYYTDREYSMARRTNEYFINQPTWPTEWILHTVPMFYYDYMYTGNLESVRNYYEKLKYKTLTSLSREDGLISSKKCTAEIMSNLGFADTTERLRDIVDWPPAQKDTGWKLSTPEGERDGYDMVEINTVVNAFYFNGLKLMSVLAGRTGKTRDSVYYHNLAGKVKKVINEKLMDKATGLYLDGESSHHSSLHANMMALALDLVPDENIKRVTDFIKSRGMACSVYGAQYLMEALYNAGEADYAFSLLTAVSDRSWWNMIRTGSTITLESWDIKYKPNTDWNHAWGAAPANIIPRCMWGIVPVAPGYAKAVICPQLSSLKYSKISVPTIRGNIEAEYTVNDNSKDYLITIPANMECDFVLSDARDYVILPDGKIIDRGIRSIRLQPGLNKLIIKSGI